MDISVIKSEHLSNTGKEKYTFKCMECEWGSKDAYGHTNVDIRRIMRLSNLEPTEDNIRIVIGDMCNGNLKKYIPEPKDRSSVYKQFCCCTEQTRNSKKERDLLFEPVQTYLDNFSWIREYLFHLSKDEELNDEQIFIYNKIDDRIEQSYKTLYDKGYKDQIALKANKLKKIFALSMSRLDLNSDDLIEFISKKKTGFFAKEILKEAQNES